MGFKMYKYFNFKKLYLLRFGVIFLLGTLAAILGSSSYLILKTIEINNFSQVFDSLSDLVAHGIHINLRARLFMLSSLTHGYSQFVSGGFESLVGLPPNITLPQFDSLLTPIINGIGISSVGFMPALDRKSKKPWEVYAKEMVGHFRLPDYLTNMSSGHWTIYDGIYEVDSSGKKIYDSGYAPDSLFPDLVTPVWEVAPIETFGDIIMYNMHSEKNRMLEIDMAMKFKFSVLSDVVETAGVPSSIVFSPLTTLNAADVLGMFFATIPWEKMLENILPSYFSGVYFVLTTSTTSYTFLIENGKATSLGTGDLHDSRYTEYKKDISSLFSDLPIALSTDYKIAMYPTYSLYHEHVTSTPGIACGAVVALVVFTSTVILFYDYVIRTREKKLMEDLIFSKLKSKLSDLVKGELDTKSSFIRYVSHEVRNPLNIVALGLDHLKRQISEENKEAVDVIAELESATKQAVEIMDNLLTFEKLTSNILELQKVEVSVAVYIENSVKFMQIQAKHKSVELRVIFDDSLQKGPMVIAIDKLKINQVIQNLLSNAIRFSPPGKEVIVRASLVHCNDGKNDRIFQTSHRIGATSFLLRLEVIDEGPGISAENQKRLFREVVEFIPGEFHDGKGSGLSLWISHQIVARHEGVLSVQSEGVGKGTTFIMELPFLDDIDEIDRRKATLSTDALTAKPNPLERGVSRTLLKRVSLLANALEASSPFASSFSAANKYGVTVACTRSNETATNPKSPIDAGGTARFQAFHHPDFFDAMITDSLNMMTESKILVVDDVLMNRKMLTRQLEQRWEDISCAEDGKVASDMVREAASSGEPYDIVLMDFEMPVMNGPDAAKVMRSEGYTGLIIGVTGNGLPVDIEHFIRQGADRVLLKPVSMSVLEDLIVTLQANR